MRDRPLSYVSQGIKMSFLGKVGLHFESFCRFGAYIFSLFGMLLRGRLLKWTPKWELLKKWSPSNSWKILFIASLCVNLDSKFIESVRLESKK